MCAILLTNFLGLSIGVYVIVAGQFALLLLSSSLSSLDEIFMGKFHELAMGWLSAVASIHCLSQANDTTNATATFSAYHHSSSSLDLIAFNFIPWTARRDSEKEGKEEEWIAFYYYYDGEQQDIHTLLILL